VYAAVAAVEIGTILESVGKLKVMVCSRKLLIVRFNVGACCVS